MTTKEGRGELWQVFHERVGVSFKRRKKGGKGYERKVKFLDPRDVLIEY